jgi:hypothetical protein
MQEQARKAQSWCNLLQHEIGRKRKALSSGPVALHFALLCPMREFTLCKRLLAPRRKFFFLSFSLPPAHRGVGVYARP